MKIDLPTLAMLDENARFAFAHEENWHWMTWGDDPDTTLVPTHYVGERRNDARRAFLVIQTGRQISLCIDYIVPLNPPAHAYLARWRAELAALALEEVE